MPAIRTRTQGRMNANRFKRFWEREDEGVSFKETRKKYLGKGRVDYIRLRKDALEFESSLAYKEILKSAEQGRLASAVHKFNRKQTAALRALAEGRFTRTNCGLVLAGLGLNIGAIIPVLESIGLEACATWIAYRTMKDVKMTKSARTLAVGVSKFAFELGLSFMIYGAAFGPEALAEHMPTSTFAGAIGALVSTVQVIGEHQRAKTWFDALPPEEKQEINDRFPNGHDLSSAIVKMYKGHEGEAEDRIKEGNRLRKEIDEEFYGEKKD